MSKLVNDKLKIFPTKQILNNFFLNEVNKYLYIANLYFLQLNTLFVNY